MDLGKLHTRPLGLGLVLIGALGWGCGGGGQDSFEGTWYRTGFPMMRACVETLEFDHGEFVATTSCKMLDESVGEMITVGTYRSSDNVLTVTPDRSSCRAMPRVETVWRLNVTRSTLEKVVGNKTTPYQKARPNLPSGVRVSGCWDADVYMFTEEPAGVVTLK